MIKKLNFSRKYFKEINNVIKKLDLNEVEKLVDRLVEVKKTKEEFSFSVGGSAGNCSHAVNDFRKLCKIESYSPIDNVSELTARINDEGWENSFKDWLIDSKINKKDVLFVFSVGGGSKKKC